MSTITGVSGWSRDHLARQQAGTGGVGVSRHGA